MFVTCGLFDVMCSWLTFSVVLHCVQAMTAIQPK